MKTILFVCTGNVCRSPMAEGLFRHALKGRGGYRVLSAGVGAMDGQPPSPHAVQAVQELGIDISPSAAVRCAGAGAPGRLYFWHDPQPRRRDSLLYPQAAEKTFLLREFDETLEAFEKDISDPIGGSYEVYVNCRDQIEQGIASMLKFIEQTSTPPPAQVVPPRAVLVAIGADHGGFELKEALKEHLQQRGVLFRDFGTASSESTDYPDFAQAVAQSVTSNRASSACWSARPASA